jgi:hypothetical protein
MVSVRSHTADESGAGAAAGLARVAQTHNFRGGDFARWTRTCLAVIGAGTIGWRLAEEAVLSGAHVTVFDPDTGEAVNRGTQRCRVGVPKVAALVTSCDAIRPGHATGYCHDVRQVGMRALQACDIWFDCTDDAGLAWALTELSNGLARPLFRCAVDGSGELELGRVLCSSAASGHACQVCAYSVEHFLGRPARTPCQGELDNSRPPTIAGGAIAAATAGLALSLAQRLVVGTDRDAVRGHEYVLDWTNFQMIQLRLERSADCLSGHHVWECLETNVTAERGTLRELFWVAQQSLAARVTALETYLLPLNVQACCECGMVRDAVGSDRAVAPACPRCGRAMSWLTETQTELMCIEQAARLGILDCALNALGLPSGALVIAHSEDRPPLRMLLVGCEPGMAAEASHDVG